MFHCDHQSVAELEQKWQNEVDEAHQGKLENNTPFFHDYHFFEVGAFRIGAYLLLSPQ